MTGNSGAVKFYVQFQGVSQEESNINKDGRLSKIPPVITAGTENFEFTVALETTSLNLCMT